MATTSPARIDDELYASAKLAGSVQSRSASQQVAHWARIGREIEASGSISHKEIAAVLAGSRSYDELDPKEQAVVRAEWAARMDDARAELDLAATFASAGRTWVELDAAGKVVQGGGAAAARPARPAGKRTAKQAASKQAASKQASAKQPTAKQPAKGRAKPVAAAATAISTKRATTRAAATEGQSPKPRTTAGRAKVRAAS